MSVNPSSHLVILNENEIQSIYGFPDFNQQQRTEYFTLPGESMLVMNTLTRQSAVYFILQWGYFRATHRFNNFQLNEVAKDVNYICSNFFNDAVKPSKLTIPSRPTIAKIKKLILKLFNYQLISSNNRNHILKRAEKLVTQHSKPKIMFKELLHHIEREKLVLPAYSTMQDIIGSAINKEIDRLSTKLSKTLPKKIKSKLKELLTTDDSLYAITELQSDIKNFNIKEIKKEIAKRNILSAIYEYAEKIVPILKISAANIFYYASLAEFYDVAKLKRMADGHYYIYLTCYVYYRTQKLNDNLIVSFAHKVSKLYEEGVSYGKQQHLIENKSVSYDKEKVGLILGYFGNRRMQKYKFSTVSKYAFELIPKDMLIKVSQLLCNNTKRETVFRWDYFELKTRLIARNIKPLFMALDFECEQADHPILIAVKELKKFFISKKPLSMLTTDKLPRLLIPKNIKEALINKNNICPQKYVFLVYHRLMKLIINNKVYCNGSISFKNFDEDIKITRSWENSQDKILKELALPKLSMPISQRLDELKIVLHDLYIRVNKRIESGENDDISIKPDGTWTLKYPKPHNEDFESDFFRQLKRVDISLVFDLVEKECSFMQSFEHLLSRYDRKTDKYQRLKACIIANGTWQGIYNMSACSNLTLKELQNTEKEQLRIKTLKAACDVVSQAIEKLSHFHKRNTCQDGYHGSVDGSKHLTKRETIQSRYSSKYFGLLKGVVSLNMIVNEVPVNCDIIGANEYEGHYLYDLYHGNTSGIDPKILSTDTAGSNLINFAILDNIDVTFAPHYKSLFDRCKSLVSINPISEYSNRLIKPSKQISESLIIKNESEIKRILASLYLNDTAQHIIVRKICCRERQTNLKKAFWAYSDIFFSIHLLRYIDDKRYKQAIRKTLNRGEAYHKLFNSVVNVGNKKITGGNEVQTKIWDHCTRLLTLIIIFYNTFMLSKVSSARQLKGDQHGAGLLNRTSGMSSRHINFHGNYHYSNEDEELNLDEMIDKLNDILDKML